jgi:hypothetical protein
VKVYFKEIFCVWFNPLKFRGYVYHRLCVPQVICTTGLNIQKLSILSALFSFVISVNSVYFLNRIKPLIFLMEMHSVFCEVKTEFYCTCTSFLFPKIKPLTSVVKSNDQPLFRVVKNEFVWKEQQKKGGACERRETSVCLLAESPFRILHFTIPAYCLKRVIYLTLFLVNFYDHIHFSWNTWTVWTTNFPLLASFIDWN